MRNTKLKEIRLSLKLNQKLFASKIGIKQSYYSALELGKKDINTSKVLQILFDKIGVSPEWYYNSNGAIFNESNVYIKRGNAGVDAMQSLETLNNSELNKEFEKQKVVSEKVISVLSTENQLYNEFRKDIIAIVNFENILDNISYCNEIYELISITDSARRYKNTSFLQFKDALTNDFMKFKPYLKIFSELAESMKAFADKARKLPTDLTGIDKAEFDEYLTLNS